MPKKTKELPDDGWQGSPFEIRRDLDPHGIQEIAIEFDTGDEEVLKPRRRDDFGSYELHQAATYLDSLKGRLRLSKH